MRKVYIPRADIVLVRKMVGKIEMRDENSLWAGDVKSKPIIVKDKATYSNSLWYWEFEIETKDGKILNSGNPEDWMAIKQHVVIHERREKNDDGLFEYMITPKESVARILQIYGKMDRGGHYTREEKIVYAS